MADGSTVAVRADVQARLRDAAGRRWRAARLGARRRHALARALPGLLVLGTQRGGTTSLYRWLADHPQVHPPLDKEIQFFSVEWSRGIDWYRCHFGPTGDGRLNYEASPYYLYHPCAPVRAASVVPKAKLIALLRDPVSRAWSHYHHNLRLGLESLTLRRRHRRGARAAGGRGRAAASRPDGRQLRPSPPQLPRPEPLRTAGGSVAGGCRRPPPGAAQRAALRRASSHVPTPAGVPRARSLATARLRARLAPDGADTSDARTAAGRAERAVPAIGRSAPPPRGLRAHNVGRLTHLVLLEAAIGARAPCRHAGRSVPSTWHIGTTSGEPVGEGREPMVELVAGPSGSQREPTPP